MSDGPIQDFPLEKYGDVIIEALAQIGITAGIAIVATDLERGQVTSTTNMPHGTDLVLLSFALHERLAGGVREVLTQPETKQ